MSTNNDPPRDPVLTLAAADPIVPELARLLAGLGYDVGPLGGTDVTPELMGAVQAFRAKHDVTEDGDGLPAETDPSTAIGPNTWAALHEAARAEHRYGIGHPDVGQLNAAAVKRAAAAAAAKRGRRRSRKAGA
jgi:peptidoglycan hydrolase-like protein with peptidoglycan-binding domain